MSSDDERQGKRSFNEAEMGLTEDLVEAIADQLGTRANRESSGVGALRERKDLEPSALAVLMTVFGKRAEKDRRVLIPGWPGVGNVDLLLRRPDPEDALAWMCELKWCGPGNDVLYEAIWDLFKMALGKTREDHPATFLMTGAQKSLWAGSAFADLFETNNHVSEELCQRRLPDRCKTIAWDDLLRGGYDKHPEHVPAEITTESVGRATIGDWELRAVRIGAVSHDLIPMTGGWPRGARPADARHPSSTPKPPTATPEHPEPTRASSSPEPPEAPTPEPAPEPSRIEPPTPEPPATTQEPSPPEPPTPEQDLPSRQEKKATHRLFRRRSEEERQAEVGYQQILRAVIDGHAPLAGLAGRLTLAADATGLKSRKLTRLNQAAYRALLERTLEDDLLSAEEEEELGLVGEVLDAVTPDGSAFPLDLAGRFMVARINDGRMPIESEPKLIVKPGETVYFELRASLMKEVIHREYRGSSSGVSFKVAPGVRYRTSGSRGRSVVVGTSLEPADDGVLSLTSSRVVFQGDRKTVESRLDRLTSVDVYDNGIRVSVSNRQTPSLYRVGDGTVAAAIVLAAAQRAIYG